MTSSTTQGITELDVTIAAYPSRITLQASKTDNMKDAKPAESAKSADDNADPHAGHASH